MQCRWFADARTQVKRPMITWQMPRAIVHRFRMKTGRRRCCGAEKNRRTTAMGTRKAVYTAIKSNHVSSSRTRKRGTMSGSKPIGAALPLDVVEFIGV